MVRAFLQVDIRFPQPGSDEPDRVTVTGLPDTVDNAIDHLLNLEDEYVSARAAVSPMWDSVGASSVSLRYRAKMSNWDKSQH